MKKEIRRDQILPGHEFIRASLFHPRQAASHDYCEEANHCCPSDAIQYSYLKPFIAYDPFLKKIPGQENTDRVAVVKHEASGGGSLHRSLIHDADFQTTFSILKTSFEFLGNNQLEDLFQIKKSANRFQSLIDRARLRHGKLVDRLPEVFEEQPARYGMSSDVESIEGGQASLFLPSLNMPIDQGA